METITCVLLSGREITLDLGQEKVTAGGLMHAVEDATNMYSAFWKVYAGQTYIAGAIDKYLPTRPIRIPDNARASRQV